MTARCSLELSRDPLTLFADFMRFAAEGIHTGKHLGLGEGMSHLQDFLDNLQFGSLRDKPSQGTHLRRKSFDKSIG